MYGICSAYCVSKYPTRSGLLLTLFTERTTWVDARLQPVLASGREQDMHYTSSHGTSAWQYMRELVRIVLNDAM